jgi:predicted Zn-ribbon and HTH transcriptional regulator
MKQKPKKPAVPSERAETVRQELAYILDGRTMTAAEAAAAVGIPERDVYAHLEHIQRSLAKQELKLEITPAECQKCGFVFKKRERLTTPGRCPVCKSSRIEEPLFTIRARNRLQ